MASEEGMEEFLERHRHKYEPESHWKARRQFMINNWSRYSGNQLASLSMVWSNMEIDGCTYDPDLMVRVRSMADGITILDITAPSKPSKQKAVQDQQSMSKRLPIKRPHTDSSEPVTSGHQSMKANNRERIANVNCPPGLKECTSQAGSSHQNVIESLAENLRNKKYCGSSALNKLHNAGLRLSLRPEVEYTELNPPFRDRRFKPIRDSVWVCNLYMGDILLSSEQASNKPKAKSAAAEKVVQILESSNFNLKSERRVSKLGRSYSCRLDSGPPGTPFSQSKPTEKTCKWRIEQFIVKYSGMDTAAKTTLVNSAGDNGVPIKFETNYAGPQGHVTKVFINEILVGTGVDALKSKSTQVAAENALAMLHQTCTVLKKSSSTNDASTDIIKRSELSSSDEATAGKKKTHTEIEESNVGHKMLKLMGWKGGALAEGGIVEPIQAGDQISREGLGFTNKVPKDKHNRIDRKQVKNILEDFIRSGRRDNLVFSSDLSGEDRKVLHLMCRHVHLKSKSAGKGKNRYLVITPKRNIHELAQDVVESGGKCGQYELVSVGNQMKSE